MASVFGVSTGDFIAIGILIKNIVQALRASAVAEHLELCSELDGLKRALDSIEHLKCNRDQETDINAIKIAALRCRHPLEEFEKKLIKYKTLGNNPTSTSGRINRFGRKVQWSLSMQEDVDRLRAILTAHVGSLNMRLLTLGLNTVLLDSTITADVPTCTHPTPKVDADIATLRADVGSVNGIVTRTSRALSSLKQMITIELVPQLAHLTDFAHKIWTTNLEILAKLSQDQTHLVINTSMTHFQRPFVLEDASGHIIPIPPELDWSGMNAVLKDHYPTGPGHRKIAAGEFEIFNTKDRSQSITCETYPFLAPGTRITMSLIIGHYEDWESTKCIRPDCTSRAFSRSKAGGWICDLCARWFGTSRVSIPRPFREFRFDNFSDHPSTDNALQSTGTKRPARDERSQLSSRQILDRIQTLRNDRKWFKTYSIVASDLSEIEALIESSRSPAPSRPKKARKPSGPRATPLPATSMTKEQELLSKALAVLSDARQLDETPPDETTFLDLGFDSLTSITFPTLLEEALGVRITANWRTFLSDDMTVGKFKELILSAQSRL